jgi:hypothetical protein
MGSPQLQGEQGLEVGAVEADLVGCPVVLEHRVAIDVDHAAEAGELALEPATD